MGAGTPHFGRAKCLLRLSGFVSATRKIVRHRDSGVRSLASGGIKQVEIAFDRIPQFVLRVAAVATVLAPPVMTPVLVADLAQMSQRRVQVVPELQPLSGRFRDQPVERAGIPRSQRRERLHVGAASDRPDAYRASDVVIPYRVQVRPPEVHEAALAEP